MRSTLVGFLTVAGLIISGFTPAHATLFDIDLSPGPGVALNLGANPYNQDHAIGLSGLNESGMPPTPASGNEIGAGITYDDVSNQLSFDIGYGSALGFVDLLGPVTAMHVHGPGPVIFPAPNINAGVQFGLAGFHTPVGPFSGRITGVQILSAGQEQQLFNNELYVNVHSAFALGGEIRGQLIAVPEPDTLILLGFSSLALIRIRQWYS